MDSHSCDISSNSKFTPRAKPPSFLLISTHLSFLSCTVLLAPNIQTSFFYKVVMHIINSLFRGRSTRRLFIPSPTLAFYQFYSPSFRMAEPSEDTSILLSIPHNFVISPFGLVYSLYTEQTSEVVHLHSPNPRFFPLYHCLTSRH